MVKTTPLLKQKKRKFQIKLVMKQKVVIFHLNASVGSDNNTTKLRTVNDSTTWRIQVKLNVSSEGIGRFVTKPRNVKILLVFLKYLNPS